MTKQADPVLKVLRSKKSTGWLAALAEAGEPSQANEFQPKNGDR